jgi:hypothetical protein
MRLALVGGLVVVGCSGGDGGGGNTNDALTCDDIEKAPLTSVPSTEWPDGLDEAILDYQDFGGRYEVSNSCGDSFAVKLTAPPFDTLEVVTEQWQTTTERCGCLSDPNYPDDTQFDVVALVSGFEVFVESWPDPALNGKLIVGGGAVYSPDEELFLRACGTLDVDPYLQSLYDQVGAVIRITQSGAIEGTLTLAPLDGSAVQTCQLSNFNLQD